MQPENEKTIAVMVNQLGYLTNSEKIAKVTGGGRSFEVVDATTGVIVYSGLVEKGGYDESSQDEVHICDFSELTTPGTYYLWVNRELFSYTFKIGDDVYDGFLKDLLKTVFYQRCGYKLPEGFSDPYAHDACHTGVHNLMADKVQGREVAYAGDVTGGWHDAGDFSVQGVSNSLTASLFMYNYLMHPELFDDAVGIPESGNGIPDVLDEARWGVEWLLKTQTENGSAIRRIDAWGQPPLTTRADLDKNTMYVTPSAFCDTGNMVATCALASRVFADIDAAFADKCLAAAKRGYDWMVANVGYVYPYPGNYYGTPSEYTGESELDEFLWAKAELFAATGDAKYLDGALDLTSTEELTGMSYHDRGGMASFALITSDESKWESDVAVGIKVAMKNKAKADGRLAEASMWDVAIDIKDMNNECRYNSFFGRAAVRMILAEKMDARVDYSAGKLGWLNFVFGSNPLNLCYVSRYGTNTTQMYHHRNCANGNMFPGVIAPGPGSSSWVWSAHKDLGNYISEDTPPLKAYVENINYYRFNEWCVDESAIYLTIMADIIAGK